MPADREEFCKNTARSLQCLEQHVVCQQLLCKLKLNGKGNFFSVPFHELSFWICSASFLDWNNEHCAFSLDVSIPELLEALVNFAY